MKKYIGSSSPAKVVTVSTPYSVTLGVVYTRSPEEWVIVGSNGDRDTTPLGITPEFHAVNTDTGLEVNISVDYKWYELLSSGRYNEITNTSSSDTSSGYVINPSTGQLWVYKTSTTNSSTRLMVKAIYTDATSVQMEESYQLDLISTVRAENVWTVRLEQQSLRFNPLTTHYYNPIIQPVSPSLMEIKAHAYQGGVEAAHGEVIFCWYVRWVSGGRKYIEPIDSDLAMCAAYIDGQGTDTLTIDADYCDGLSIMVFIYTGTGEAIIGENYNEGSLLGEADNLEAASGFYVDHALYDIIENGEFGPDQHVFDTVTLAIINPRNVNALIQSQMGGYLHDTDGNMVFNAQARLGGIDISDSIVKRRLRFEWNVRRGTTDVVSGSYGSSLEIRTSSLKNAKAGAQISASPCMLGGLLPLVDSNGDYIVDGDGKFVCGRA